MTIAEGQAWLNKKLLPVYDRREAANIADWVLEHLTGLKRIDRVVHKDQLITEPIAGQLKKAAEQLAQHMPVQYVIQQAWFYGLPFFVNESVLIPRPETEELVDWIVKDTNATGTFTGNVLDIGTGSGCIPISLKKNIPAAIVYGIDISTGALHVAQKNAAALHAAIHFQQADILYPPANLELPPMDIIVSNPPYIPLQDKDQMRANVLNFEPHLALFVPDESPLLFYEAIASFAALHLNANGVVYAELHEELAEKTKILFLQKGFDNIIIKKDMQGKQRMLKARKIS